MRGAVGRLGLEQGNLVAVEGFDRPARYWWSVKKGVRLIGCKPEAEHYLSRC